VFGKEACNSPPSLNRTEAGGTEVLFVRLAKPQEVSALGSGFIYAVFHLRKRAASQSAKFSRGGVEFRRVVGAARLERGEPAAEAGELIRRQLGNSFGDFFYFHVPQYSTAWVWLSDGMGLARPRSRVHQRPPTESGRGTDWSIIPATCAPS
jgi:hypothetical protein